MGFLIFIVICRIFWLCIMWNLVPWPGINPRHPVWSTEAPSHWTTRDIPRLSFMICTTIAMERYCYYCHFTEEKAETWKAASKCWGQYRNLTSLTWLPTASAPPDWLHFSLHSAGVTPASRNVRHCWGFGFPLNATGRLKWACRNFAISSG